MDKQIQLYLGDCLDIMKTMPDKSIDLVLTDPPYGINVQRVNCASYRKDARSRDKIYWDTQRLSDNYIEQIFRVGKRHIIWGANHLNCFLDGGAIVWDKLQPLPDSSQCEIASISGYKKVFKYQQRWTNFVNTKQTEHPTEKPVELMKYCIGLIKEATTILDPFMGSGTTGVAAKELGRKFIGIEINEEYMKISQERIKGATSDNK